MVAFANRHFQRSKKLMTALTVSVFIGLSTSQGVFAANGEWSHATTLSGEARYAKGFPHFDYVNPEAPKGGPVRLSATGSFDTFNPVLPKGEVASGMNLVYETLMMSSMDEADISAQYGLLASAISYPEDFSSVSFRLNPDAKWADGKPVTIDDVIWSFNIQKELNPQIRFYYQNVVSAESKAPGEVTFGFDVTGNRELPHIMGQLMVLPKHWWEGVDANGEQRDIRKSTLEAPLGSGPYQLAGFEAARNVSFKRNLDYWGANLNVNIGKDNFDEIRYEYFRDPTVLVEALKGDKFDFRAENSAKNWSTAYEGLQAREAGFLKLEKYEDVSSGVMQAYVPNMRREKFKDPRVRRALNYAYDFETTNRTVYFDLYLRVPSYFAGTELASSGLPSAAELELLEPLRGQIPDTVFTEPFTNPVAGDTALLRQNLREAVRLFKEAGYSIKDGKMVNDATGEPFEFEFLDYSEQGSRAVLPWKNNLEKIGVTLNYRVVDTSQYIARIREFDFDIFTGVWGQSLSPGNEQRNYWGSESKDRPGSRNYAGISDPAVDSLIDKIIFAEDRKALVTATKALDRVLLHHHYVIPQLYYPYERIVYWDRFGHPDPLPKFTVGFPTVWWWDAEKAARIGQ